MPLIVTPGQLARRADFYHQLSQLTAAGLGLIQALEIQVRSPADHSFRGPLRRVLEQLSLGATFADALQAAGGWLPSFDLALLQAAERSGRLPATFELLAAHYTSRAQMLRQTLSSLAYPIFVFHFAVLVMCLLDVFQNGSLPGAALKFVLILAPFYVVAVFLVYAAQGRRGERWRRAIERVLHRVPLAGPARRNLALARLSAALEALLTAGVNIFEAWEMAAAASGSPALHRAVLEWRSRVESGVTPGDAVAQTPEFPELFANLYRTGEISGSLDDTLRRLHALHLDEGTSQLKAFVEWMPKLIFFLVAGLVAYVVIKFYVGYFAAVGKAIDF